MFVKTLNGHSTASQDVNIPNSVQSASWAVSLYKVYKTICPQEAN